MINSNWSITVADTRESWKSLRFWLAQTILISATLALPAIAHLAGLSVRTFLPMHWPVLIAGLMFGWRGGLVVGLLSPVSNWMITGHPLPLVLPAMTLELTTYGFITGWARYRYHWNSFASIATGIAFGRIVFIISVWLTAGYQGAFGGYLPAALAPGIWAAIAQIALLGTIIELQGRIKKSESKYKSRSI